MHDVMSNMELHLAAAEGYEKTGTTVALDGTEDHFIVREAADFWNDLHMREKIDAAVAEVREEVRAGRLSWTLPHILRLIKPYPKHRKTDEVLEKMKDDTWIEEGQASFVGEGGDAADEHQDDEAGAFTDGEEPTDASAVADEDGHGEDSDASAVADEDWGTAAETAGGCAEADADQPAVAELDEAAHENLRRSQELIATLQASIAALRASGAIKPAIDLENEIRKEKRRMRTRSKETVRSCSR
jgi:hypothetical protein